MKLLSTPHKAWHLGVIAVLAYASSPLFTIAYYSKMLRKGAYHPNADSIGIPIFYNITATVLIAPVFFGLIFLALRRYPGSVSLSVWNSSRPVWSWAWSLLFGAALAGNLLGLGEAWHWGLPLEFLNTLIWAWVWLLFRAAVVARSGKSIQSDVPRPTEAGRG